MDYALVSVLITILNVFLTVVVLLAFKGLTRSIPVFVEKITNDLPHIVEDLMQSALNDAAPTIQEAISQGLSTGLKSAAGSVLAKNSAASRQMKSLEKDLISNKVDQIVPGMGEAAAKYIQKYPMLMDLIQKFGKGQSSVNSSGQRRGKM